MKYSRLTREERHTIDILKGQGLGVREIALELGRAPSTISRELTRHQTNDGGYCYVYADSQSKLKHRGRTIKYGLEVWKVVDCKIRQDWSPEQITGHFRAMNQPVPCHEWIYQHLLKDKELGGELYKHLRHPVKSYRKRGLGKERRGRIKNQVMIDERPEVLDKKDRIGDWELDTVIGTHTKKAGRN